MFCLVGGLCISDAYVYMCVQAVRLDRLEFFRFIIWNVIPVWFSYKSNVLLSRWSFKRNVNTNTFHYLYYKGRHHKICMIVLKLFNLICSFVTLFRNPEDTFESPWCIVYIDGSLSFDLCNIISCE